MTKSQALRVLVNERLTAAAEEIFALFENALAEYEEELRRSINEDQRKPRLLEDTDPGVLLFRAAGEVHIPSLSPGHKMIETARIKEEPSVKQEEEQPSVSVPESHSVCVTTNESSLPQRETAFSGETEEEIVSGAHLNSEAERLYHHFSDWDPSFTFSEAQMETEAGGHYYKPSQREQVYKQVEGRDRSRAAQNSGQHYINTHIPETSSSVIDKTVSEATEEAESKKHQCFVCGRRFRKKQNLERHTMVHTGEKPYSCSLCNKRFSRSSHLSTHMRTHTGEKPFSCLLCKKHFSRDSSLRAHMKTHAGIKPYSCSLCTKMFSQRAHLNTHEHTHR